MKNKYVLLVFLLLPLIVYACWIKHIETRLAQSKTVMIAMQGYDPVDLLSGHYLLLRPDWSRTDCSQFEQNVCPTEIFSYSYRYYLPEFEAMDIDKELVRNSNLKVELEFAVNGMSKPMVKQLYLNGQIWQDWFSQFAKQPQTH